VKETAGAYTFNCIGRTDRKTVPGFEYDICLHRASADKSLSFHYLY